jgi:hypothetical protein
MSQYTVPPPNYRPASPKNNYRSVDDDARSPLLGNASGSGGFYDQPAPGELPDDFKVCSLQGISLLTGFNFLIVWRLCSRKCTRNPCCFCAQGLLDFA